MSRIAAVVGSRAGWFALRETPLPGPWSWFVTETFEEAMRRLEDYEVVAVDAPLSLAELPPPEDGEPGIRDRYRRPAEKVSATAISAVVSVKTPGVLPTGIPCPVAASTSTLL